MCIMKSLQGLTGLENCLVPRKQVDIRIVAMNEANVEAAEESLGRRRGSQELKAVPAPCLPSLPRLHLWHSGCAEPLSPFFQRF